MPPSPTAIRSTCRPTRAFRRRTIQFITGIVSNGGSQFATFNVNAFGDGTLTLTSSGAQYVMTDWHVIKVNEATRRPQ